MTDVSFSEFFAYCKFDKKGETGQKEYKLQSKPVIQTIGNLILRKKQRRFLFLTNIFICAFTGKSTLLMEGETMAKAFRHHREASILGIENRFNKLQKLLEAECNWKKIIDAKIKTGFTK
uniref:Uncharacterized protein n=1 Tax=Amphimedon queenslandica TaxID=400682 RepID=A0A1X7TLW4_AMPQE